MHGLLPQPFHIYMGMTIIFQPFLTVTGFVLDPSRYSLNIVVCSETDNLNRHHYCRLKGLLHRHLDVHRDLERGKRNHRLHFVSFPYIVFLDSR